MDGSTRVVRQCPSVGCWVRLASLLVMFCGGGVGGRVQAAGPLPQQDDATLLTVHEVTPTLHFAAGANSACWRSTDGGQTWLWVDLFSTAGETAQPSKAMATSASSSLLDVTWRSISFVDEQTGWLAGTREVATIGPGVGVLLQTTDAGQTWKPLPAQLPAISALRFFDEEVGLAVTALHAGGPAGLSRTEDGGHHWEPVIGEASAQWTSAVLIQPDMAVLGGRPGTVSLLGGSQLHAARLPPLGRRGVLALDAGGPESVWLVGEGGLLLHSRSGGVAWEIPDSPIPQAEQFDFQAVAVRGDQVWVAGSPGSVIWKSSARGTQWKPVATGQTLPIHSILCADEHRMLATTVGGGILRSVDGGERWQIVRGGGRRMGVLQVMARSRDVDLAVTARLSGVEGYRSAAWVMLAEAGTSSNIETTRHRQPDLLAAAFQQAGGNAAQLGWQWTLDLPGLDQSGTALVSHWQSQTENRLGPVFLGQLVRLLRQWQPDLVVSRQPATDDAVGLFLQDALERAVVQAADSTRYPEQGEIGLGPWQTKLHYTVLPPQSQGDVELSPYDNVPGMGTALKNLVLPLEQQLDPGTSFREVRTYRRTMLTTSPTATLAQRDWWNGVIIPPGSPSRRIQRPLTAATTEADLLSAKQQRQFDAVTSQAIQTVAGSDALAAQLSNLTSGLSPAARAVALRELWSAQVAALQWDAAEATATQLLRMAPDSPHSREPLDWLIMTGTSRELAWYRQRHAAPGSHAQEVDSAKLAHHPIDPATIVAPGPIGPGAVIQASRSEPRGLRDRSERPLFQQQLQRRRQQAQELAQQRTTLWPASAITPSQRLALIPLQRELGNLTEADRVLRSLPMGAAGTPWRGMIERELWLSQGSIEIPAGIVSCSLSCERPYLDGLLSDLCWQDATELKLASSPPDEQNPVQTKSPSGPHALVMLSADRQFLYLAGRFDHAAGQPVAEIMHGGRQHDAEVEHHDRLNVALDLDRDYQTTIEFTIDARGCTRDVCCGDAGYNPRYFVAAESDTKSWRFEAAIPWRELTDKLPQTGDSWGLRLRRTTPNVGWQSWVGFAREGHDPAAFGLVKFGK